MLTEHLVLGLKPGATDDQIRKRYLELIKKHSPEQDPQRFREISTAYERIKTQRARIHHQIFGCLDAREMASELTYLANAVKPKRKRVGLVELLQACRGK